MKIRATDRVPSFAPITAPSAPAASSRPFEVFSAPAVAPVARAEGPLERFRAGEIDLAGYIDAKVESALAPFLALPAAELAFMRDVLRQACEQDPVVRDLIAHATSTRAL